MLNMLIVRLVPKEKEHKDSARCFGCKPAKERARTTTIGENAARYLSRYGDSDAMTLSEISLSKKLFAFRNMNRAYEKFAQIIICVDASGWNSRLRNAAIAPISAASLDPVFGVRMYAQSHEAYHRSYFYLPDVDHVYTWDGQDGGVEGQDTYIWVHAYIQQLKIVMTHFGYPYRLLVKGDDARLVILIPPQYLVDETLDQIRSRLVTRITELSSQYGHQMKPEDSYGSEKYCSFSKNAFIGNVEMPQSFRKIQKAYGANNAFMNTIDDYAASSFSNCHSASKTSPSPVSCYIVALMWFYIYLMRNNQYKHLSDDELVALSLIPNVMGGFPIIYLHNFYQRCESDLLSSYIHILRCLRDVNEGVYNILMNTFKQVIVDPQENIEMLCIDPYSLPLKKPSGCKGVLRTALSKTLKRLTRNEQIRQLFEARDSGFHEALLDCLSSQNIYSPKIMNQIYSASPEGLISELIAKFESGKSMLDAVLLKQNTREGLRILKKAARADKALHDFRVSMIKGRLKSSEEIPLPDHECPSENSQELRERLWCRRIEGITQSPVSHMVHLVTLDEALLIDRSDLCHFKVNFSAPKVSEQIFSEGPYDAFLGDSTSKGLVSPEAKLTGHNIFALKIANLLETYRWTTVTTPIREEEIPLSNLVAEIIHRYTRRNVTDFIPFSSARPLGKTVQHHVRANQFRPSIVPNTLQNVYTWCSFDMLSHKELTTVHGHSKYNFLEIKCWGASMLASRSWMGEPSPQNTTYWITTTNCVNCNLVVEENTITYNGQRLPHIDMIEDYNTAKNAINEILREVDEFRPEMYHMHQFEPGDDSIEESIGAICQALMDQEWRNTVNSQELEAHHILTHEGNEVIHMWSSGSRPKTILDFNDLLGVNVEIIIDALAPLVISSIFQRFEFSTTMALGSILTLTPANILPWTGILIKLATINKFRPLQDRMSRLLRKVPNIIDNPSTYSARFGDECMQLWHRGLIQGFNITLCTAKADTEIANSVKVRINAIRLLLVEREVRAYKNVAKGTPEELEAVLTTFCYMVRMEFASLRLEFDVDNEGNIIDSLYHVICTDELDMEEEILTMLETMSLKKYSYLLQHIKHLDYKIWHNLLVNEYDIDTVNALEEQDTRLLRQHRNPQISVRRVDLLACKNALQVLRDELPERGEDWDDHRTQMRPIPRGINTHFVRIAHYDPIASVQQIPQIVSDQMTELVDIHPHDNIVLDRSWTVTPIGLFNISMSRLCWLLEDINVPHLGDNRIISVFGDGYGGYAQVINQLTNNSRIIFMTSPTSLGETPIPTLYPSQNRNNILDTYMIEIDRWDLSEISNFIRLEEHRNNLIDLVCCDAELPNNPSSANTYLRIWHNVCTYVIRNCKTNCVLIIKVYLEFWREILVCLNLIRPYTSVCTLLHSSGSPFSMEVYIVAQFQRSHPLQYASSPILSYPPEICQLAVVRFVQIYIDRFIQELRGLREIPIRSRYPHNVRELCMRLPSYGWTQLESVIRTSFDYTTLRQRDDEARDEYYMRVISLLNTRRLHHVNMVYPW